MGILSDDSRSVFEIGEEELAKQQEEAKNPSSILSIDDATNMGMLRENNETNTQQPQKQLQEGQSNGDREFEKLSVGDSWKDAAKAVGSEAGKLLLPNRDNAAGRFVSDTFFGGHSEDDIWNYQAKTHFGEAARTFYEWGVPTLATMGAGTAIGVGLKATKIAKLQKAGSFFTKYLGFEDAITTTSTNGLKKAGVWTANAFLTGSISGGLVDVVKADHDRIANNLNVNEAEHPLQAAFIRSLQDDGTDNQFTMRTKALVEGFFMGGISGVALGSLIKVAGKTISHFKTAKAGLNATTKEEAENLGKQFINEEIDLQKTMTTLDKVDNVNTIFEQAAEQGADGRDVIKAKFKPADAEEMIEMYNLREQGEEIFVHDDGTWDISVKNWEDAYKVSEDSYKAQLASRDTDRAGDTAIAHSNQATETTWRDRGWVASGENLVTTDSKGVNKGNTNVAKRIVTNYKDKWKIDNNVKVEFIDGNGSESKTTSTQYLGKTSKSKQGAIEKAKTKIDAQQLKVDKAQDKVTMLEGGNEPVMEDIEVAKRELAIAKKQLADLKNDLTELEKSAKNQDRITNITIQIDKNSKTPYADLRAELEHARDIAKGEVPVNAQVEGSGVHFSRYTGDNEAEVAGGYTYGKSVARAKKNNLDTLNSDKDVLKYKAEGESADVSKTNTSTTRINESGVRQNDGRSSSSDGRGADSTVHEGVQLDQKRLGNSSLDNRLVKEQVDDTYNLLNNTYEASTKFVEALNLAKSSQKEFGEQVYTYTPEEYSNMKLYLSDDGKQGFAIKPDGDLVSVFVHSDNANRGEAHKLVELAKKQGATKLDCFDTYLVNLYKKHGFVEVGRDKWNDEFAPKNWNKEKLGEPDVVYMQLKDAATKQPTQYEQLKLNFNTAEDLSNAVKQGEVKIQSFEDCDNIVNNLVEKDTDIQALTVKDMENNADFKAELENSDNVAVRKAAANNDKETLLKIFKKEIAIFKHIEGLIERIYDSSADTPLTEISDILTQINKFGMYMKGIASAAGTGLGQHAYFKEVFNKSFDSLTAYSSIKEGALELADIIKGTLGDTLNFTRGHKISAKDFDKLFNALMNNEKTADLVSDKEFITYIRKTIQDASDKGVDLSVDDMVKSLIRKSEEQTLREIQSNIKLAKKPSEAVKMVLDWNREVSAYYVHNLLSGVGSTERNVLSGALNTLYYPLRKIFAGMDILASNETKGELFSEGIRTYANMLVSAKEAMNFAIEAFKKGEGKFNSTVKDTLNSTESNQGLNWMKDLTDRDDFTVGDYARNILSFMSRVMGASDEFLKQLNYRSIVRAKADDYINSEALKGLSKENKQQAYDNFFKQQFTSDGLPANMDALSEAQAITYQQNLNGTVYNAEKGMYEQAREMTNVMKFGDWLHKMSNQSVFVKIPFPFIKTGMNILNQNLEHNLLYNLISKSNRKILMSDTKEGALLRSQCFVGMSCLALGAGAALAGVVTGSPPKDTTKRKALYRTGWRPYSVKIGNTWVSYTGIEPIHTWLGFAADSAHLMMSVVNPEDETSVGESIMQGVSMFTANFLDKAAFRAGISQLNILFNPDTQDTKLIEKELAGLARGMLPLSSFGRNVGTVLGEVTGDAHQKTPTTLSERIFDKYFVNGGLGEYRRNVFGEKQDTHTLALVANMSKEDDSFEMEELDRLAELGFNPKEISKIASRDSNFKFNEFKNQDGYSMYEVMMDRLAELEIDGYTLREAIRNRIMEDDYISMVDGTNNEPNAQKYGYKYSVKDPTKINALREIFSEYIAEAKREVVEEQGDIFFNKDGKTLNEALEEANEMKMQTMIEASLAEHNADKIREY